MKNKYKLEKQPDQHLDKLGNKMVEDDEMKFKKYMKNFKKR